MEVKTYRTGRMILAGLEVISWIGAILCSGLVALILANDMAKTWLVPLVAALIGTPFALLSIHLARAVFDIADHQRHIAASTNAATPPRPTDKGTTGNRQLDFPPLTRATSAGPMITTRSPGAIDSEVPPRNA